MKQSNGQRVSQRELSGWPVGRTGIITASEYGMYSDTYTLLSLTTRSRRRNLPKYAFSTHDRRVSLVSTE